MDLCNESCSYWWLVVIHGKIFNVDITCKLFNQVCSFLPNLWAHLTYAILLFVFVIVLCVCFICMFCRVSKHYRVVYGHWFVGGFFLMDCFYRRRDGHRADFGKTGRLCVFMSLHVYVTVRQTERERERKPVIHCGCVSLYVGTFVIVCVHACVCVHVCVCVCVCVCACVCACGHTQSCSFHHCQCVCVQT